MAEQEAALAAAQNVRRIFFVRLALGLLQGLALYLLYYAHEHKAWPATEPNLFAPFLLVSLYVPLLTLQAFGNLRKFTLIVWVPIAAAIAAGFAWYDIWHGWPEGNALPSAAVVIFTAVFLFIVHALISCGEADRRIIARYPVLFDLTWKQGVQLVIAAAFAGAFWIVLYLGVALFDMIKLDFFRKFIEHDWFAIPVTTLVFAVAVHITDTRTGLVRGVRSLALMLLGWLLPVIALIAFMFLISLVFTGLDPLWQTRWATGLLIFAAFVLVALINSAYQDGNPEQRPHHVLRVAGTLGSVLLIFIMALAGYALYLRIAQYGLTVDRIDSAACVLVLGFLAIGYTVAAVLPGLWLKLIERWNVFTTFLALGVLFALFTPIADPLRLSVNDQVSRLERGIVAPKNFDFFYLRYSGGRFGKDALSELSKTRDKTIAKLAAAELTQRFRYQKDFVKFTPKNIATRIKIYPSGKKLPATFLQQDWKSLDSFIEVSACLNGDKISVWSCSILIEDFDDDGNDDILLFAKSNKSKDYLFASAALFTWDGKKWQRTASLQESQMCNGDADAILAGKAKLVPKPKPQPDLEVNGKRLTLMPQTEEANCK